MAEEDVDWGMDDDFDPWQPAEEQAVVSHSAALPSVGANDGNIAMQNGDFQSGGTTAMAGWTLRTSRNDIAKQYYYNPYTREATWSQPGEMVFDESGIVTPPPLQLQQVPGSHLQMRASARLTDHMKMAPIHNAPIDIPTADLTTTDSPGPATMLPTASRPTSPAKLRLIDRIQPARYVPPERRETVPPFVASEPVASTPAPVPQARPGKPADQTSGVPDISRKGDSYRPQYQEPTLPAAQPSVGPADGRNKEEGFASRRHTEKLPEWLEANNPKLDLGGSSRRRARDNNEDSSRSASVKRVRVEENTPSRPAAASLTGISDDSKSTIRDAYSARNRGGVDSKPSGSALRSNMADNPNSRNTTPLADRLQPRASVAAPPVPTAPGNSTSHQQFRPAESERNVTSRQTPNGLRGQNGNPDNPKVDNRSQPAPSASTGDRKLQQSSTGGTRDNGNLNVAQNSYVAVPPGSRNTKPSGANTAPLIANRWSQNASPRTGETGDSKATQAMEQVQSIARNENDRSKEYIAGTGANQPATAQTGRTNNSSRDTTSSTGTDINRNRHVADAPNAQKNLAATSQPSPRQTPSQSELNAQQAYARAVPRMSDNRPSGPSLDRSSNLHPARPHASDQYTPSAASRNAWNGDSRPSNASNFSPSDQNLPTRSSKESMPSPMPSGFRRSDPVSTSNPSARPPISSVPARTRSPAPHLPTPSWSQTNDRRSPPRQAPGPGRRRSPSPPRINSAVSRYPPPRFDDRAPPPSEAFAPSHKMNPRDEPKPHPRAPDLYTPGGRSPPRQQPRGADVYDARGDPRGLRFETRNPSSARGPPGRR